MYTTKTTMLDKLASGEDVSWQEFYHTYLPLLREISNKSGIPATDADDLAQETAAALFNDGKFNYRRDIHGKFRTYLGGIIRHKISDFFRNNPRITPENYCNQEVSTESDFEKFYIAEYRKYILKLAIDELKSRVEPESFEAFQLCILRNLPDKEAASLLGAKPNTIAVRKKRCREILKSIIIQLNENDPDLGVPFL